MRVVILVFAVIFGTCFGSFVCCQARRFRRMEQGGKKLGERSVCLGCGYQLKWYDNVPILSWIFLGGKCRKCGKKIGRLELLAEILGGIVFGLYVASVPDFSSFSAIDFGNFFVTLVFLVSLGFLAIYDGMWGELPQVGLTFSVICGIILLILKQWRWFLSTSSFEFLGGSLLSALGAVGVLGGVYFLLYFCSRGKLVGDGDWILGLALGLALGDVFLAVLTMFFANALAAIVILMMGKAKKGAKVYFGPWMILGYFIVLIGMETFMNIF